MSVNNSLDDTFQESEMSIPRSIRFWLFLLLDISSIYCTCILLFYLFICKTLRSQLSNHIIIVLLIIGLIIELVAVPFHLSFLHLGVVQPSVPFICLTWWFIDIGLHNGCTIIMAWGSVQRYLLIFNDRIFSNKTKRIIFHHVILIILLLYIMIFYIIVIFFPPCMNTYDYTLPVCNDFPCYLNHSFLGIWDSIINNSLSTFIICIASISILVRVHCRKRHFNHQHQWRKERKMIIQLCSNSVLYLIPNFPLNILIFAHLCGLPENIGVEAQLWFDYLCYFVILLFPFVCLGYLSELRKKMHWTGLLLFRRPKQTSTIAPQ